MPDWMRWQIEWIVQLQALQPPWAIPFWRLMSFLGEEQAFLLILPALLWGYRKREALYTASGLLLGSYLTFVLKDLFATPRPFHVAPDQVRVLLPGGEALGYGLPSGHALNAAALWGTLAGMIGRPSFTLSAIALVFLIGFSRIVLGVHFVHDVLAGWGIGAMVAFLMARQAPLWIPRLTASRRRSLLLATGIVLLLFLIHGTRETAVPLGAWLGMAWGAIGESWRNGFDPGGPAAQRGLRLAFGLLTLGAVYGGLTLAFSLLPPSLSGEPALRLLRYAGIGLWVTWGAPVAFLRLGLARNQRTMQGLPTDP
ncbi:MAG: phosphatase PAP2 family protein [Anaerolineae bacterium]|nr:phosphatase PAP2 family protein [Anaerolineae bacterium]